MTYKNDIYFDWKDGEVEVTVTYDATEYPSDTEDPGGWEMDDFKVFYNKREITEAKDKFFEMALEATEENHESASDNYEPTPKDGPWNYSDYKGG